MTKVVNLTACSWGEGRIDVFGVDPLTGNVLQRSFENESWSGEISLGNPFQNKGTRFQGYITACSWGNQRIDIFGADSNGQLLHYFYEKALFKSSWNAEILGQQGLTGQMTACSWGKNRIDIFGLDNTRDWLIQYYFDGKWEGPVSHDYTAGSTRNPSGINKFAGNIAASSWGPERIDIFGQDSIGRIEQVLYDNIGWKTATLDPSTNPTDAAIVTCAQDNDRVDTFWIDNDGNIKHYFYDGGWLSVKTIDNQFPGRNWTLQAASTWGKGRVDLFGQDDAGNWLHVTHGWAPEILH